MHRSIRFAAALSVITFASTALPAPAEPLKVVASFSIIGDFARNVGGDRIALTTLVGPNGDAHVYEPKPADAAVMAEADVVLVNGLHFEGFFAASRRSERHQGYSRGTDQGSRDAGHDGGRT